MQPASRGVATFEVLLADDLPTKDIALYMRDALGMERWKQLGKAEKVKCGNREGERILLSHREGKEETLREVVGVHRGERTYFFSALYSPADKNARFEVRQMVEGVDWKN